MEPKYSRQEQRARMAEFERAVKRARADWRRGYAYIILSFEEYCERLRRGFGRSITGRPRA